MTAPIEWIVFDIGGVCISLDINEPRDELARRLQVERSVLDAIFSKGAREDGSLSLIDKYCLGKITTAQYIQAIAGALEQRVSPGTLRGFLNREIKGVNAEVIELVHQLSQRRSVACFSNTHALHWQYLQANFPFFKLFDVRMASHLAGVKKPDAAAFEYICETLEVDPPHCLFIDDLEENVRGARKNGLPAIHFQTPARLRKDLQNYDLYH